jgi:hypothetical protein
LHAEDGEAVDDKWPFTQAGVRADAAVAGYWRALSSPGCYGAVPACAAAVADLGLARDVNETRELGAFASKTRSEERRRR